MRIQHFYHERTASLSYVVADEPSRTALVIDPVGDFDPRSARISSAPCEEIARWIEERELAVPLVIDTHAHADHLSGMPFFRERFGARGAIGRHITRVQETLRDLYGLGGELPCDGSQWDLLFDDGDAFEAGGLRVEALHSPGHTPACTSYRIGDALFVGDVLFMPDYGTARCDFPGGSAAQLYDSIQRLYELPDSLRLHTGHDYRPRGRALRFAATLGEQKRANVQLSTGVRKADFVAFRERRDKALPLPDLMLAVIQMNVRAGLPPPPGPDGARYLRIPLGRF
jgi:glyoxylase-like metal-dependent hydrolase (beta-lactamase superfamily II)